MGENLSNKPTEDVSRTKKSPSQEKGRQRISVIGGGINGMIAAHYLARAGNDVTLFERSPTVGGACVERQVELGGQSYGYPGGASVFGFMQDFVYRQTGLKKRMKGRTYVPSKETGMIIADRPQLGMMSSDKDFRTKAGETGNIDDFHSDEAKVVAFLQKTFRAGIVPTFALARKELGQELTKRWIDGTGRELVDHYFTSDPRKMMTLLPINESGPTSIDAPQSAFTIPLMHSGNALGGEWGFVRGGLHTLLGELNILNEEVGVNTLTSTAVCHVDPQTGDVTFQHEGKKEEIQPSDLVIFATEPLSAARLIDDKHLIKSINKKRLLGTAGKLVAFFKKPFTWKQGDKNPAMFRTIFASNSVQDFENRSQRIVNDGIPYSPNYFELYPEGAADRLMGANRGHDILSVYFQSLGIDKSGAEMTEVQNDVLRQVLSHIGDDREFIGSILLSPKDLQRDFGFAQGNIDHIDIGPGQTFFARGYSADRKHSFFQFGDHERILYCGAGTYPCGSIAGTAGYMCAKQAIEKRE
ncbi:MAG TPA: FAD-dependent oxidoreductase [Candidatus Peribacterales bacterium]|nr:FAD-dependent oxidoreductase [Candidatus Peribacterales bacterium]